MNKFKKLGYCGPAVICKGGMVEITKYPADDSIALVVNPGTEDAETYSVCLAGEYPPPIKEGHVWLKGWSENKGVPAALEAAKLIELTGNTWTTGYVEAQEARLIAGPWADQEDYTEEEKEAIAEDWDREMLGDDADILAGHDIGNK